MGQFSERTKSLAKKIRPHPITAMHDFVVALNTCFATIKPIGLAVQDVQFEQIDVD
jgi:hypothetical protein